MDRISFKNETDRKSFFLEIKEYSGLSWNKISKIIGTAKSMLETYRKGKILLPEDRFTTLLNLVILENRNYYLKRVIKRESNWGQKIGGKKAYKINKDKFDAGRKRGAIANKDNVKYDFDINMILSEPLCEFLGAIIGDGFTNRYQNFYQTQITGDKKLDLEYYYKMLKPMCETLFKITPKITEKPNCIRLNIYSKRLFEMLTKRFYIPAGKKCYSVKIPEEILKSEEKFINVTLRGMFDTDGGVGFDKRKSYKKPYVRINYTSSSSALIEQVHRILEGYKIAHSIHKKNDAPAKQIQINGEKNVQLFLRKIGFSNPRHLNKIGHLL